MPVSVPGDTSRPRRRAASTSAPRPANRTIMYRNSYSAVLWNVVPTSSGWSPSDGSRTSPPSYRLARKKSDVRPKCSPTA